jgi:hypothetical protein
MPSILAALLLAPLSFARADGEAPPVEPVAGGMNVAEQPGAWRISGYWENDSRTLKPNNRTDRWYTNGVGLSLSFRCDCAAAMTDWIPFGEAFDAKHRAIGFTAGQLMFTPEDIENPAPILSDRPYAGYLYGGVFLQRSDAHTLDHLELDLGVVGPSSLAENAQIFIHSVFDAIEPEGWDNQLHDEPAIQFYLRKKWRTDAGGFKLNDIPPVQFQLIPQVELAVGSVYRHLSGGVLFRVGINLPDDFGPDRLTDVGSFTEPLKPKGGGYVFVRAGGKVVEHNLFLEGNSSERSQHVDAQTLVGEVQVGFGLQFNYKCCALALNYSQTFVTKEFEDQTGSHGFGALTASLTFRF